MAWIEVSDDLRRQQRTYVCSVCEDAIVVPYRVDYTAYMSRHRCEKCDERDGFISRVREAMHSYRLDTEVEPESPMVDLVNPERPVTGIPLSNNSLERRYQAWADDITAQRAPLVDESSTPIPEVAYSVTVCTLCTYSKVSTDRNFSSIEDHRCSGLHGLTPKQVAEAAKVMETDFVALRAKISGSYAIRVSYTVDGKIQHIEFFGPPTKRVRTCSLGLLK